MSFSSTRRSLRRFGSPLVLTLAGYAVLSACSPKVLPPPQTPSCRLSIAGTPQAGGPVEVLMSLNNASAAPVYALSWGTPFEDRLMSSVFRLTGPDGAEVPFEGPMVKRGEPKTENYIGLLAGAERSAVADLAQSYDFSRPGSYRLEVVKPLLDLVNDPSLLPRTRDQHVPAELSCAPLTIEIPAPAAAPAPTP